ncbi:hypothetical protein [Chachezhania sediminis]|uniref:hypothetical protein n=1 Tax=Chachezhania sediminis TaxID=2599291 RepID=UPI00131B4BC2|nr:hypothetical protein [Chachezhania sediminis]
MKIRMLLAAGLMVMASTAVAEDIVYKCEIKPGTQYGWIPETLFLSFNRTQNWAWVYDAYVKNDIGKPMEAKLRERDAKSIKLDWSVDNVPNSSKTDLRVDFFLVFWPGTGKILVQSIVRGYDMQNNGHGICAPYKEK